MLFSNYLIFTIMDNKIFKVYKGALLAKKFADENLAVKKKSDNNSDFLDIKSSAEKIIASCIEVFKKTFSEDLKNYPRIDIQDFFNNLNCYSEILIGSEIKFFLLVRDMANPCFSSIMGTYLSWCWPDIYSILSKDVFKDFIHLNKPHQFKDMVLTLAKYLDPTRHEDKEKVVSFFRSLKEFHTEFPDLEISVFAILQKECDANPYKNDWIREIIKKERN